MSVDRRDEGSEEARRADTTRRSFLSRLWLGLGGLAIAEYVWLMVEFLRPRPAPAEAAAPEEEKVSVAKNLALFFAAPFIGLAYIIAFPFIGAYAMIRWGFRAATKS